MSLSWQHCTHLYSPLSLCLTAAAHVTHLSTRTHTYRNIWTTANQRGGPPFTISDWFRPRYKPNGSVFCWVSESRILFFSFLEWLDAPVRPGIFVSHTREKLGRTCDQIGRTLEPCLGRLYSLLVRDVTRSDVPITPWIDFTCVLQDLSRKAFPKRKADATEFPERELGQGVHGTKTNTKQVHCFFLWKPICVTE